MSHAYPLGKSLDAALSKVAPAARTLAEAEALAETLESELKQQLEADSEGRKSGPVYFEVVVGNVPSTSNQTDVTRAVARMFTHPSDVDLAESKLYESGTVGRGWRKSTLSHDTNCEHGSKNYELVMTRS